MKLKNLTRLLFVVLTVGLVTFGPLYGNRNTSAVPRPFSTDRYVATGGSDTTDCSSMGSPCLTIQYAIDQSGSGDTIHVAAGTYSDPVNPLAINKTLTLSGAQAGVDARNPRGLESILSNSKGASVSADGVVIDGFTIQDSTIAAFTGYGVWINPGKNGTQVLNNIFQNNIVGLGLSNGGASQALIEHNLFQNNNNPGGASGTGIYTDQFVSGAVSNVLIDENKFTGNENAGIGFSSKDTDHPDSNITITGNMIDKCGRGVYFYNTQSATVTGNTITNCTLPTDLGASAGISAFGNVDGLTITNNDVLNGAKYGIRIGSFICGSFDQDGNCLSYSNFPNKNVEIHYNNIVGNGNLGTGFGAGLFVDDAAGSQPALSGSSDFATCNWWGSATGPTNPVENPSGTGDAAKGSVVNANFNPWLIGPAPDSPCGVPPAGAVTACKFYDFNANGVKDPSEQLLNGWPITINPLPSGAVPQLATQLTNGGCVSWSGLANGQYTFSEGTPTQSSWVHTTPASLLVTVANNQPSISFGNVCLGSGGGLTPGFWQNKQAQDLITGADLCALNSLNLKNADGTDFNPIAGCPSPTSAQINAGKKALQDWIKGSSATNMAYQLSVHLAAMKLNVLHGFVSGSAMVFAGAKPAACSSVPVNSFGFISINDLIADANLELGACGGCLIVSGNTFRVCMEFKKNTLDKANSDKNFVQATPCRYSFR